MNCHNLQADKLLKQVLMFREVNYPVKLDIVPSSQEDTSLNNQLLSSDEVDDLFQVEELV